MPCSKTFIYLSAFIVPSKTCKLLIPYALMHPHTIRDAGFWTERLITHWKVSLLFSLEDTAFLYFQQECQIWTRLTIEHFSTLKQSILNEPWSTGHDGASGPCSHMASFQHDRALVGICRWHSDSVYRQWFLEVFLGPFSNVNDRIMLMSDAVSSEGLKTTGIQQRSSALSLTHRDFSNFSESVDDVMHCREWDLQSLCNLTLRNVVFTNVVLSFYELFHRLESLCPSLLLRDSASLRHPFYS